MADYGAERIDAAIVDDKNVRITMPGEGDKGQYARADLNTLAPEKFFIYFDVGRWGETQYNFGLAYGDGAHSEVLLCEYLPDSSGAPQLATYFAQPATLLNSPQFRRKVRILKSIVFPRTLGLDTANTLYIFLGDLHLPLVRPDPISSIEDIRRIFWKSTRNSIWEGTKQTIKGDPAQRAIADMIRENSHYIAEGAAAAALVPGLGLLAGAGAQAGAITLAERLREADIDDETTWWQYYNDGDIFRDAGESLASFLDFLNDYVHNESPNFRIHLIQVGDLYDLWIGLQRLFEVNGDQKVKIAIPNPLAPGQQNPFASCVRSWIRSIHRNNMVGTGSQRVSLPDKLYNCYVDQKTWISGNHDNYLLAISGDKDDPPPRVEHLFDNGIQVEHGHRADEFNKDGALEGHAITQLVFIERLVRLMDPDRRAKNYFPYAALKFRDTGKDMKLFVMAHTHAPYLAPIFVTGQGV